MVEGKLMNYRNAKYTESGTIDCEIEHPYYGWIPTSLSSDDSETAGLFETVVSENAVADYVATVLSEQEQVDASIASIRYSVEEHIAILVKDSGYDNRLSYAKYVGYQNQLQLLSEALGSYEADVWMYCKAELAKVSAGDRAVPTVEEFIAELPVFTAPQ